MLIETTSDLQERLRRKVSAYYARGQSAPADVTRLAARLLSHRLNELEAAKLGDPVLAERYYDALVVESEGYASLLMREGFDVEEVQEMLNRVIAVAETEFNQSEEEDAD